MKIKLRTLLIACGVIIVLLLWAVRANASLNSRISLHGGQFGFKSYSLWELHQYKDTVMMRRSPLCWCPYRAYLAVWHHVSVFSGENRNWLVIDTDLTELVAEDAQFNRAFAKSFKASGTRKNRLWKIFRWVHGARYTSRKKFARDIFETRQGDCAAFAAAFYVLCKAKGIPVRYVIGWTKSGCHAWNRVRVGGRWYWIDCVYGFWLSKDQFDGRKIMEIW